MKVLHLDSGRGMRGGQYQVLRLVEGLRGRADVEQRVLARGELAERLGAEQLSLPSIWSAVRWADVVHAHDAKTHTLALVAGAGDRLAVSRRVAFAPGKGMASRWKYRRAALYLAVSEYVAGELRGAGVDAERIRVVHDGVPTPEREPVFREPAGPLRVLALDSEDPGKGTATARRVCLKAGFDLTLTKDLERDLRASDCLLYLTDMEGFGSAIVLAALRKVPVIASRVGGIPEVLEHDVTGLLVDKDEDAIVAALGRLRSESPELGRRLAEAAYLRAVQQYRADIMVDRTVESYQLLLRG